MDLKEKIMVISQSELIQDTAKEVLELIKTKVGKSQELINAVLQHISSLSSIEETARVIEARKGKI